MARVRSPQSGRTPGPPKQQRFLMVTLIIGAILAYMMIIQPWRPEGEEPEIVQKVKEKTESVKPPPRAHFKRHWKIDGMPCSLTLMGEKSKVFEDFANTWFQTVRKRLKDLEPDGEGLLGRINQEAAKGPAKVEPWLLKEILSVKKVGEKTRGQVDLTLGAVRAAWNLSSGKKEILPPDALQEALKQSGWNRLDIDEEKGTVAFEEPGMKLDLWPVRDALAAKLAIELLKDCAAKEWAFRIGRVVSVEGKGPEGPWTVEVPHPRKEGTAFSRFALTSGTVASWDDNGPHFSDKGFRYHEVFDVLTGVPSQLSWSATVLNQDPVRAQAYAYAMFVLGARSGGNMAQQTLPWLPVVWVTRSGDYFITEAMQDFLVREDFEMKPFGPVY